MSNSFHTLNLTTPYLNALHDLGLETPTPIQAQTFPLIMSGRDVIGVSQTGTGKTIAYLLPLLRLLPYSKDHKPKILILVPTRELSVQVEQQVKQLIPYTNLQVQCFFGGANIKTQSIRALEGADIMVSTPGRLFDLVMAGAINLKTVNKLVIDEADEMLNLGLRTQLIKILDLLPPKRQSLLFSATFSIDVEEIIQQYFKKPEKIEIARPGVPLHSIEQKGYEVPNFYTKANLLEYLVREDESMNKVLVFTKNKNIAELLYRTLQQSLESTCRVIHTGKSQNFRIKSVKSFAEGEIRVLIATDLIARGIDIENITHVVNFNLPQHPETYIHRIGRTGRAENDGKALSFIDEKETPFRLEIEKLMDMEIPMEEIPEGVKISNQYLNEEKLNLGDVNYRKPFKKDPNKGSAFEEKAVQKTHSKKKRSQTKTGKKVNRNQLKQKAKRRKK